MKHVRYRRKVIRENKHKKTVFFLQIMKNTISHTDSFAKYDINQNINTFRIVFFIKHNPVSKHPQTLNLPETSSRLTKNGMARRCSWCNFGMIRPKNKIFQHYSVLPFIIFVLKMRSFDITLHCSLYFSSKTWNISTVFRAAVGIYGFKTEIL